LQIEKIEKDEKLSSEERTIKLLELNEDLKEIKHKKVILERIRIF
jgi:hypothetical protein